MTSIADLVEGGRIEPVTADIEAAKDKIEEAKKHLKSAPKIADEDPQGAYALIYDSARKAVDAHMLASGYRVKAHRPGAHAATAEYAELQWDGTPSENSARRLDRIRRNRNRAEYGAWHVRVNP